MVGRERENGSLELMNKYAPTAAPYNLAHVSTAGGPVGENVPDSKIPISRAGTGPPVVDTCAELYGAAVGSYLFINSGASFSLFAPPSSSSLAHHVCPY
jgi:hypothetical protein